MEFPILNHMLLRRDVVQSGHSTMLVAQDFSILVLVQKVNIQITLGPKMSSC